MRTHLTALISLAFSLNIAAQSLSVNEAAPSNRTLSGTASAESVSIQDADGLTILTGEYSTPEPDDPSLRVYPFQNGSFVVRENVVNFIIYDAFGNNIKAVSNSSGSREGEAMSELSRDMYGKTIVLYNPSIIRMGVAGSRARILDRKGNVMDIYNSDDREIRTVRVSESGEFIALAAGKEGSDDEVIVMDRYGNEINRFEFDQEVNGLNIYGSGRYLTIYSTRRAVVYDVLSGDRIGSTSFRNTLHYANYSSGDQSIIGLTGDLDDQQLEDIEVHVINVAARQIAREAFSGTLSIDHTEDITLERRGRFSYRISGLSKDLNLQARF